MKFQIFIHSIGDRGIRTALDAIEYAEKQNGPRDRRDELVHIECLNEQDIPRFKELGAIACRQPRHCAPDITGQWAKAVGPQRWKYAWAFRSLKDAGATLAFASDWNVAEMEPVVGIYTALTRKGLDGKPEGGWVPEQTIDLETCNSWIYDQRCLRQLCGAQSRIDHAGKICGFDLALRQPVRDPYRQDQGRQSRLDHGGRKGSLEGVLACFSRTGRSTDNSRRDLRDRSLP